MASPIESCLVKNSLQGLEKILLNPFEKKNFPSKPASKPSSFFTCTTSPNQSLKSLEKRLPEPPPEDHFYNQMGEKIKNWTVGFGYITDPKREQDTQQFQKLIDGMSPEEKDQFVPQAAINCEIPGMKSGLGCWLNTKAVMETAVSGIGTRGAVSSAEQAMAKSTAPLAERTAFEIAQAGGKNAGQLKRFMEWTPKQLEKSIKSFERLVVEHEEYIRNPKIKYPDWDNFTLGRQQNEIHHWTNDIIRAKEYKSMAEKTLKLKMGEP